MYHLIAHDQIILLHNGVFSSTALGNDDTFFSAGVIIAIVVGSSVLLLILLLLMCCCVCYCVRARRNHQKYYVSNTRSV